MAASADAYVEPPPEEPEEPDVRWRTDRSLSAKLTLTYWPPLDAPAAAWPGPEIVGGKLVLRCKDYPAVRRALGAGPSVC